MRPRAEAVLWFVAAAAPLTAPLAGVGAIVALALLALLRREGRAASARALRRWPVAWWLAVPALAVVHALAGAPWWDLMAATAWALGLASVLALPPSPTRRAAVFAGAALGVGATVVAAMPQVGAGRLTGLLGHPNVLAAALTLSGPLLVVAARRAPRRWRWVGAAVAVVALAIAWLTGSRALWLGTVLGAAAWAVLLPVPRPRARAVRALAVVVLASGALVVAGVRGLDPSRLFTTDVERGVVQGVALTLAAERPLLGHGGAPWADLAARVEPSVPTSSYVHAHSLLLHLLARGGAVAVAAVLVLLLAAAPTAVAALRRASLDDPWSALALAVAVGVVVTQAAVDLVLQHPAVYVGLWVLVVAVADRARVVSSATVDEETDR